MRSVVIFPNHTTSRPILFGRKVSRAVIAEKILRRNRKKKRRRSESHRAMLVVKMLTVLSVPVQWPFLYCVEYKRPAQDLSEFDEAGLMAQEVIDQRYQQEMLMVSLYRDLTGRCCA